MLQQILADVGEETPLLSAEGPQILMQLQQMMPQHQIQVPQPLNNTTWQHNFADKIMLLDSQDMKSALIQIKPPELG